MFRASVSASLLALCAALPAAAQDASDPGAHWRDLAQSEIQAQLDRPRREGEAKNVIVFIADGMNLPTITAARILQGQREGGMGEDNVLPFEEWGHAALIKTYTDNAQVADSAATATAIHTGVKSHNGAISVYARQTLETCGTDADLPPTLLEMAEDRGLSTGIIATARITHATPATAYAHVPSRNWESDAQLPPEAAQAGCRDIARQWAEFDHGDGIELTLGGGLAAFRPEDAGGQRTDGRDLTAEWTEAGGVFVSNASEFRDLDPAAGERVLGLFTDSHMAYDHDRDDDEEPSLAEMTTFAIDRLSADEDGYYLMVEAGRVDHAHHGANAHRALTDMLAFSDAVEAAAEKVDLDETLIIVTADHGHVFSIAGYPRRGNPILGLVRPAAPDLSDDPTPPDPARDGRPYTTLGYYTGPNIRARGEDAAALTDEEAQDPDFQQQAAVPMGSETHSGEDIAAYAVGPWAHLVDGTMEQHTLHHLAVHALGWSREDGADSED